MGHFSWNWFAGSLVLGAVLGLIAGVLSALISKSVQKPRKEASWNGKSRGGIFGNWILKCIMRYGGLKPTYFVLHFVAPCFYFFAPKARRASDEYWRILKPEASWLERQSLIVTHFLKFARTLADWIYRSFHPTAQFTFNSTGKKNILQGQTDLE